MPTFDIHHAKTHMESLVMAAAAGEEIIIAIAGRPVVRLMSLSTPVRRFGKLKERIWIADDFDRSLECLTGAEASAGSERIGMRTYEEMARELSRDLSNLDPVAAEQSVRVRDGCVQFDDIELAEAAIPGLVSAWKCWAWGITVSPMGIPERDWLHFLSAIRHARSTLLGR